jgi:hypothetical protein
MPDTCFMPLTDFIFMINYNVARLVESDLETEAVTPCSVDEQFVIVGRCITAHSLNLYCDRFS